jgi:hypothetical protein
VFAQEVARAFRVVVEVSGCDELFQFVEALLFLCNEWAEVHEKRGRIRALRAWPGPACDGLGLLSGRCGPELDVEIKTVKAARGAFTVKISE